MFDEIKFTSDAVLDDVSLAIMKRTFYRDVINALVAYEDLDITVRKADMKSDISFHTYTQTIYEANNIKSIIESRWTFESIKQIFSSVNIGTVNKVTLPIIIDMMMGHLHHPPLPQQYIPPTYILVLIILGGSLSGMLLSILIFRILYFLCKRIVITQINKTIVLKSQILSELHGNHSYSTFNNVHKCGVCRPP